MKNRVWFLRHSRATRTETIWVFFSNSHNIDGLERKFWAKRLQGSRGQILFLCLLHMHSLNTDQTGEHVVKMSKEKESPNETSAGVVVCLRITCNLWGLRCFSSWWSEKLWHLNITFEGMFPFITLTSVCVLLTRLNNTCMAPSCLWHHSEMKRIKKEKTVLSDPLWCLSFIVKMISCEINSES